MSDKKIIAYKLVPIYEPEVLGMVSACMMQCAVTGQTLSTSGGGPEVISPKVYDKIKSTEGKTFLAD